MRQSHYTIYVWKISQSRRVGMTRKMVSDGARCSCRAIHTRQNTDVIACSYPPIGTHNALKRSVTFGGFWFDIFAKCIVAGEVTFFRTHIEVVYMHMVARRNGATGKTDDLVVTPNRLTSTNIANGNFVSRWNQATHVDMLHGCTTHQLATRDDNVVRDMESNKRLHKKFVIYW